MSKRINERFLTSYIELEKSCSNKFGVATGGVTEYINRLNNARYAPGREEALPRLVRYRSIRNKMVHDVGSLRKENDVSKLDIKWIKSFHRDLIKSKDPMSIYLRRARGYARRKKILKILIASGIAALVLASVILIFVLVT